MKIDSPLYRIVPREGIFLDGALRSCGAEVVHVGWPKQPGLEPINTTAKRIAAFFHRWQAQPGFPPSPHHHEHGLYLPGHPPRFGNLLPNSEAGSDVMGFVADADAGLPTMPEYSLSTDHLIGNRRFKKGDRLHFVGWPPEYLEPANEPARRVTEYYAEHRENPKLLVSPWCWLRGLILPPLSSPRRDGKMTPAEQARFDAAVAAEVEHVTGRPMGKPFVIPTAPRSGVSNNVRK